MRQLIWIACLLVAACDGGPGRGPNGGVGGGSGEGGGSGGAVGMGGNSGGGGMGTGGGGGMQGCAVANTCYSVYAHSDHVLYSINLMTKELVKIGPFNAPKNANGQEDVMTDLAVAPDNTIYVISKTFLYTADPNDGHVTQIGSTGPCGTFAVALSFMPDGSLYTADFNGAFCKIDVTHNPTAVNVTKIADIGNGMAIAGDLVAVGDGTMYGTAYNLADGKGGSALNNYLITINPSTGTWKMTQGQTGFPKLFGVSYALGQVFGFTHDGSGDVITIDPKTGVGTLFKSFSDNGAPISFAGAGVNAMVASTIG